MSLIQRQFFKSIPYSIRTIIDNNKFYFNIIDISIGLQYTRSKYLYNYYYVKCNDIIMFNNDYTETQYLQIILNRSRKPNAKQLLQEILELTKTNFKVILPNRVEEDIFNSVKDFLQDEDFLVISNYKVGPYFPDIIICDKNQTENVLLIIEINEHDHPIDKNREKFLKRELSCEKFLNINPHDKKFSTGKLLKKIIKHIK